MPFASRVVCQRFLIFVPREGLKNVVAARALQASSLATTEGAMLSAPSEFLNSALLSGGMSRARFHPGESIHHVCIIPKWIPVVNSDIHPNGGVPDTP